MICSCIMLLIYFKKHIVKFTNFHKIWTSLRLKWKHLDRFADRWRFNDRWDVFHVKYWKMIYSETKGIFERMLMCNYQMMLKWKAIHIANVAFSKDLMPSSNANASMFSKFGSLSFIELEHRKSVNFDIQDYFFLGWVFDFFCVWMLLLFFFMANESQPAYECPLGIELICVCIKFIPSPLCSFWCERSREIQTGIFLASTLRRYIYMYMPSLKTDDF